MPATVRLVSDMTTTTLPHELGSPREDQMQGSALDRLTEICGRVCYESVGNGRSSAGYHAHIREVGHHSVYRHANLTFAFDTFLLTSDLLLAVVALWGRPGVQPTSWDNGEVRFTCNLQAAIEWHRRPPVNAEAIPMARAIGGHVADHFHFRAPQAFGPVLTGDCGKEPQVPNFRCTAPVTDDEVYASLFFSNISRVCSHEMVRHTWLCAPSQRSGRYVDDTDTPWIPHPLLEKNTVVNQQARGAFDRCVQPCREEYVLIADLLTESQVADGVNRFTARKQARSAARGVLGNGLMTELVFSAPISMWKEIFRQRINPAADQEIALAMTQARDVLAARWPERFPEVAAERKTGKE